MLMKLYESDKWFLSRRFWAAVLLVLSFVLMQLGYHFSDGLQTELLDLIAQGGVVIGGILTIISKVRESKRVTYDVYLQPEEEEEEVSR